jgi:hypothetical protein
MRSTRASRRDGTRRGRPEEGQRTRASSRHPHLRRCLNRRPQLDRRSHRPAVHLAGIDGKKRLQPAIAVRDVRGIGGDRQSHAPWQTTEDADLRGFYGSEGTRTRDLRRDRPVVALAG